MAKTVHVVFKTHLDIGFTDFAAAVVQRFIDHYIPQALRTARELREAGGRDRFVWTTGSWLIFHYLEKADRQARMEAEDGILAGDLRWHGLPFTTHSELLDPGLFRFGLGIAAALDARFGIRTIAAKMSDVPGHTRGIVPLLAEAGIRFLHIGVNAASRAPVVPPLFRWQDPDSGADVMVMYNEGGYGGVATVEKCDSALCLAHTDDNLGPQSKAEVVRELEGLRARFPDHEIRVSTLDAFAADLEQVKEGLPLIREEIGDTWIHGTGSDPWKTAGLRALMRLRERWMERGNVPAGNEALRRFSEALLMVAEHSWGMDTKTHLADYESFARKDFEAARARDVYDRPTPPPFSFMDKHRRRGVPQSYGKMETSWKERRAYLHNAVSAMQGMPLAREAARALDAGVPQRASDGRKVDPAGVDRILDFGLFRARFSPRTGALVSLVGADAGRDWAAPGHPLGLFRYQSFSSDDYDRFLREYLVNLEDEEIRSWAVPDYGRPGLTSAHSRSSMHLPRVVSVRRQAEKMIFDLELPPLPRERYGAPAELQLVYTFPNAGPAVEMELSWFGKPATRTPEAAWMSFAPATDSPESWQLHKMGRWISPLEVVSQGGRNLHGIGRGVRVSRGKGGERLVIESLDAHLVSPGEPRLLRFDDSPPPVQRGMHYCLHNNLWGTNFPLWYEDDARFRFRLRIERDPRGSQP